MRNHPLKFMAILSVLGLAIAACKPKAPDDSGIRYVAPKDGLNMREEPSTTGKKMLTIPKGAQVQKLEERPEAFKIDNIEGKWTKISWQGKTGWVFGGFLSISETSSTVSSTSAPTISEVKDVDSLRAHFASLWFVGPGATKERGSLDVRGLEFECGGTEVIVSIIYESGLTYDLVDVNCDRHGRGDCRNCRKENPRTCTVSPSAILAVDNGGKLDGGECR